MNDAKLKMLDRVRALLAKTMANGCTEGEAMAALAKAQELMAAYEISEAELGVTQHQEGATIHKYDVTDPYGIRTHLCMGVAKFTRCKVWKGRYEYGVAFCGLDSEVVFATWLLDTLQAFVMRELKQHQAWRKSKGLKSPRIISASFVRGCSSRIYERLRELSPKDEAKTGTANALVLSRNSLIKAAMDGIKLRAGRKDSARVNGDAYAAGKAAGDSARFDRPVNGGGALRLT